MMANSAPTSATAAGEEEEVSTAKRCQFYLPNKRRHCANSPIPHSQFCGNHNPSAGNRRIPCPVDPSHSILKENLDFHIKRCPLSKQTLTLETQPYYAKGINGGSSKEENVSSEEKRNAIHELTVAEFHRLVEKIKSLHSAIKVDLPDSYVEPNACQKWLKQNLDRGVPYQEKHVLQQVSILGNMEAFGILQKPEEEAMQSDEMGGYEGEGEDLAVVEFGAGRGYLTNMLADCYGIRKVLLVERRSYKLKADRSLRQKKNIHLERLRIDIEDLNLHAMESLRQHPYLAIGKHLCGFATDLAIRCCLPQLYDEKKKKLSNCDLQGLSIATCCHHLCQWKYYPNTKFMASLGITKEDFHAITWFSSWAVDADHSCHDLSTVFDQGILPNNSEEAKKSDFKYKGVEEIIRSMQAVDRATLGFICKEIVDIGRLLWLREHGLEARLVKYVPPNVSPENHLLLANCSLLQ